MSQRYNSEGAKPDSKIWAKLSNEGPTAKSDMPVKGSLSPELKQDGVDNFRITGRYGNTNTLGTGKNQESVYYIRGKHTPESVLSVWLDENYGRVSATDRSLHAKICQHGKEWKEASREHLGKVGTNNGGGEAERGGTCPMCGGEFDNYLPDHLPGCQG